MRSDTMFPVPFPPDPAIIQYGTEEHPAPRELPYREPVIVNGSGTVHAPPQHPRGTSAFFVAADWHTQQGMAPPQMPYPESYVESYAYPAAPPEHIFNHPDYGWTQDDDAEFIATKIKFDLLCQKLGRTPTGELLEKSPAIPAMDPAERTHLIDQLLQAEQEMTAWKDKYEQARHDNDANRYHKRTAQKKSRAARAENLATIKTQARQLGEKDTLIAELEAKYARLVQEGVDQRQKDQHAYAELQARLGSAEAETKQYKRDAERAAPMLDRAEIRNKEAREIEQQTDNKIKVSKAAQQRAVQADKNRIADLKKQLATSKQQARAASEKQNKAELDAIRFKKLLGQAEEKNRKQRVLNGIVLHDAVNASRSPNAASVEIIYRQDDEMQALQEKSGNYLTELEEQDGQIADLDREVNRLIKKSNFYLDYSNKTMDALTGIANSAELPDTVAKKANSTIARLDRMFNAWQDDMSASSDDEVQDESESEQEDVQDYDDSDSDEPDSQAGNDLGNKSGNITRPVALLALEDGSEKPAPTSTALVKSVVTLADCLDFKPISHTLIAALEG